MPATAEEHSALASRHASLCLEHATTQKNYVGCLELVDALQLKLAQVTKQRDAFESLSRRLQDWQRASQSESQALVREEVKRSQGVHSTAMDLLGKYEASLKHTSALEAEKGAYLEREAQLLQRQGSLEQALEADGKLRELQGKLLEALKAEGEAVKADREGLLQRLAQTMAELEVAKEQASAFRKEVESFGPRIEQLSSHFDATLAQQKLAAEKVRQAGRQAGSVTRAHTHMAYTPLPPTPPSPLSPPRRLAPPCSSSLAGSRQQRPMRSPPSRATLQRSRTWSW